MKYTVAVVALLTAAVQAQSGFPEIPKCSLECITGAIGSDGCESLTDFKCHCSKPQLISQVQPCLQKACSPEDQQKVATTVAQTCKSAGVPINLPPVGGSSSAAAPASSSAAPASSAPASTSSAVTASSYTPASGAAAPTGTGSYNPSGSLPPFVNGAAAAQAVGFTGLGAVAAFVAALF